MRGDVLRIQGRMLAVTDFMRGYVYLAPWGFIQQSKWKIGTWRKRCKDATIIRRAEPTGNRGEA